MTSDPVYDEPNDFKGKFVPEEDVFDTWMTSSVSPLIATKFNEKLLPMSLRPQIQDIISTWAFYTILKHYYHFKEIPWMEIAIGTFVLDDKGIGMSKSKGNSIWADDVLKNYDVDTLRYWVGAANFGSDLRFSENEMLAGKKFLTKLWNSSKFSLMFLENYVEKKVKLESIDEYFLIKLNEVVERVNFLLNEYNIADARRLIDNFFWNSFCDNYLEIVKKRLYNDLGKKTESAKFSLYKMLITILKLYAPIVPHITEEIYSNFSDESIHLSSWPEFDSKFKDNNLVNLGDDVLNIISKVRKFKADNNKSMKEGVKLMIDKKFELFKEDLESVCNAEISFGEFNVRF